jgi:hypothetical protein
MWYLSYARKMATPKFLEHSDLVVIVSDSTFYQQKQAFMSSTCELIAVLVNTAGGHMLTLTAEKATKWRLLKGMLTHSITCPLELEIDQSFADTP